MYNISVYVYILKYLELFANLLDNESELYIL